MKTVGTIQKTIQQHKMLSVLVQSILRNLHTVDSHSLSWNLH